MSDKEPGAKKQKGRAIGGISQWGSFGSTNGEDESQTAEPQNIQTSRSSNVQTTKNPDMQIASNPDTRKSKHPEWKQKTIYMPADLAYWLNVHAAQAQLEISEIVVLALSEYRKQHP